MCLSQVNKVINNSHVPHVCTQYHRPLWHGKHMHTCAEESSKLDNVVSCNANDGLDTNKIDEGSNYVCYRPPQQVVISNVSGR